MPGAEPAAGRSRWRLRSKLLLAVGGMLVGLVLAEVALQLAGVVVRQQATRGAAEDSASDVITILCVGDSHTYGLPLPEEESYPAQLEVALSLRHPNRSFRVVNLGVPSLNSAFVANRLERQIFQLQPELVIVWVGINNLWNVVETLRWERPDAWLPLRRALMSLKLFRLASIVWFNATGHQYDPNERGGWFEGELAPSGRLQKGVPLPDPAPGLSADLERMFELTRTLETPILFVSYPMRSQQPINHVIEQTGGRLSVGVIDTAAELRRALADGQTLETLIDRDAGAHPSGTLYGYVVQAMLPVVEGTLASWHEIDLVPPKDRSGLHP